MTKKKKSLMEGMQSAKGAHSLKPQKAYPTNEFVIVA